MNGISGAPRGIRTPDLLVRSQTLYPAELLAHFLQPNHITTKQLKNQYLILIFLNFFILLRFLDCAKVRFCLSLAHYTLNKAFLSESEKLCIGKRHLFYCAFSRAQGARIKK